MSLTIPGLLSHAPVSSVELGGMAPASPKRGGSRLASAADVVLEVETGSALEALHVAAVQGDRLPWASIASANVTCLLREAVIGSITPGPGTRTRLMFSADRLEVRP